MPDEPSLQEHPDGSYARLPMGYCSEPPGVSQAEGGAAGAAGGCCSGFTSAHPMQRYKSILFDRYPYLRYNVSQLLLEVNGMPADTNVCAES